MPAPAVLRLEQMESHKLAKAEVVWEVPSEFGEAPIARSLFLGEVVVLIARAFSRMFAGLLIPVGLVMPSYPNNASVKELFSHFHTWLMKPRSRKFVRELLP